MALSDVTVVVPAGAPDRVWAEVMTLRTTTWPDGEPRWDVVEARVIGDCLWAVYGRRHVGTLAETSVAGYFKTPPKGRSAFRGGYRDAIGSHGRIRSLREWRVWSGI